ncbi:hypothetical protein AMTRI_Chr13g124450 [Amborella trichopoda]
MKCSSEFQYAPKPCTTLVLLPCPWILIVFLLQSKFSVLSEVVLLSLSLLNGVGAYACTFALLIHTKGQNYCPGGSKNAYSFFHFVLVVILSSTTGYMFILCIKSGK